MTANTDTSTRTLPAAVQDFIAANFENPVSRSAKTQAALDTYACLWADERGDLFPEALASDVCQALLLGGEDMAVKLALAVRDCIDREDAAWGGKSEESSPDPASATDAPLIPEISPERGAELTVAQHTASAIDQAVIDSADVFKAIGRIEASTFFAKIGNISAAQFAQQVRDGKKYKGLPYDDEGGNRKYISTFDEFCDHFLGKTGRYVRDLVGNLHLLGSDLYESAERIGFRAKDYRALKALPAEDQAVVKQALESETKDEVLDILQDLAAKHQAEREAARKERDDLSADLEARGKLLEDKAARLEKTEEELYKLKSLPKDADLELKLAREQEAVKELNNALISALAEFNAMLLIVDTLVETDTVSTHTAAYATQTVQSFCQDVQTNLANYGIPVDFEDMVNPSWMRETAQADLEAGQTNTPNGRDW